MINKRKVCNRLGWASLIVLFIFVIALFGFGIAQGYRMFVVQSQKTVVTEPLVVQIGPIDSGDVTVTYALLNKELQTVTLSDAPDSELNGVYVPVIVDPKAKPSVQIEILTHFDGSQVVKIDKVVVPRVPYEKQQ